MVGAWGNDDLIENAFALEEYEPDATVEVGALRASFHEVPHFTQTFAIDFSSANGGGRFTYGADCRPGKELVEIARDTDLLLVEATLPRPERTGDRGHMTPAEAGDHAKRAGRQAGRPHAHLGRARRGVGARPGHEGIRATRGDGARGRRLRRLTPRGRPLRPN